MMIMIVITNLKICMLKMNMLIKIQTMKQYLKMKQTIKQYLKMK